MDVVFMRRLWVLLLAAISLQLVQGQVVINEFVAAASDRLLQREPGTYPRVGNTTPWQASDFDDSHWRTGPGPFGFGTFSGVTIATGLSSQMQNRAASLYLRQTFNVTATQAASGASLELLSRYNDGFIAFINGVEVARRNMGNPGMFAFHDQTAFNTNVNNPSLETISLGAANTRLVAGENVLCIQAYNQSLVGAAGANFLIMADLRIAGGDTLVNHAAPWKYFPGLAEPSGGVLDYGLLNVFLEGNQTVAWAALEFNDSPWPIAPGPVGIEGANPPDYILGVNLYSQTYNITPSIYTRRVFSITPAEAASESPLRLTIDYDDGLIVYLNGKEVVRRNVGTPGTPTPHNVNASSSHSANGDNRGAATGQEEVIFLAAPKELLLNGDNVLAVQLHRSGLTSSDSIARVTLATTGTGGRTLCQPTDPVSYFVGTQEPVLDGEQEDMGPLEEAPDSENDWIELHNAGGTAVSLTGWSLTDNANNLRKWMFPTNTTISAGGYLLVLATGLDTGPAHGATYLHSNFKLTAQGEYLALVNGEAEVVTEFAPAYPSQHHFHSYGRDTNGHWGHLAIATPGNANTGTALASAPAAPAFSLPGGFHNLSFSLVLTSATAGAAIRYTLDGSEPNPGLPYTSPIAITTDRIIRARAVMEGAIPSPTITHTYLLNESFAKRSLPALCLGGNPGLTFYGPNTIGGPAAGEGIFAIKGGSYVGDNSDWTHNDDPAAFHFPLQRGRATEKPATLEFFPTAGEVLRTDFGLRISGSSWSRPKYRLTDAATTRFNPTNPTQKPSFNLYFRSEWGERPLDYPFFGDSPVTRFNDVRVRAGKNDISNPFLKDELMRRLYLGTGQKSSIGIFNTVYVNGVFKGYFNLCERLREGFMQEHHQSSEAWDVQQVNEFSSGDPLHWKKMFAYLRSTNLAGLGAYQGVHDYLDLDNYIDYIVVNAFAAMWDWPHNNWVAARERSPAGRWRFYMWDAEGAFGIYERPITYNTFTGDLIRNDAQTTSWHYIQALYTLLRVSPEFRLRFGDRVQKHFFNGGTLVKTNMQATYLGLRNTINPIMQETLGTTVNEGFYNTWIVSDTRRNTFFTQLTQQGLWPATLAPTFSHYGGVVTAGLELTLSNPNGSGAIYYATNGTDPRAPGGGITGTAYTSPITVNQSTTVQARVRSSTGVWSPVIKASFTVPPPAPTFLPTGSGDWTLDGNWSSAPLPYPNGAGAVAILPPPTETDRNVNLRAPVTIGHIYFPQASSTNRNRVRDQDTGNTLTFHCTNGPARVEVGGAAGSYVEFEVLAGTMLQSDLRLHVTNIVGHAEHGALRLRANWAGPGGLIKSGPGVASLTGEAKTYTGATLIEEGVLLVTQPATPTASTNIAVQAGGQLRLISANDVSGPRIYNFGGPLSLAGLGRGPEIPEEQSFGRLGALRYDPGSQDNQAILLNPVVLTGPTDIHVDGARNTLELRGGVSGTNSLTKTGGGTLLLSTDSSLHTEPVQVENGTLALAGSLGSPVNVAATATLTGHGQIGFPTGSGILRLNQTALHAPGANGLVHHFGFGKTGSPVYAQPAAAGNGLLVLQSAPVGPAALDVYLSAPPMSGDHLRGGFFVPFNVNLAGSIAGVPSRAFMPDMLGTHLYEDQSWSQLTNVQITTVAEAADFGHGLVQGRILEIRVDGAPATFPAWQAAAFSDPADLADPFVSGPGADPQGVGVANLLRYALGLTLTDDPDDRAPEFAGSISAPAIRFPFDAGRNDIAYVVESTTDVTNWSSPAILFDSRTDFPPATQSGWITVSDPTPPSGQRYYRLRVLMTTTP
ncbi:MAG: chitobiase/beta-hexosaminidase C-terminal domain-containing protein [Verrucomicrobia bacterium]|nr:chitobiase/beta-hexosaminidase C-terminal domain-containing protein [Verrucomicrobiota bacterium]